MRSGQLISTNDYLIEQLLLDKNYDIRSDGSIWTCITVSGKRSVNDIWRRAGTARLGYWTLKYKKHKLQIHRIIYARYKGKLEPDLVISHLNDNGLDNRPENIELVTQSKNNHHRFRLDGGLPPVMGNKVLTWEIVRTIRNLKLEHKYSHNYLAKEFGISKGHISEIINNKIWIEGKEYS